MAKNENQYQYIPVLTIAGSDSGGGAGIQADLKTIAALGCYGISAITAITIQNTLGVTGIHHIPAAVISGQIEVVMEDIRPKAIKIGMIHDPEAVYSIAASLQKFPKIPIVLDPVMVATSGDRLIRAETVAALVELLFPLATLVTPNLDEAKIFTGVTISTRPEMENAGNDIIIMGANAVLVKGGHLDSDLLYDVLVRKGSGSIPYAHDKIPTDNTHGTGCTLSAAIACGLAKGMELTEATDTARTFVYKAIASGAQVKTGNGKGPLNHFFAPVMQIKSMDD